MASLERLLAAVLSRVCAQIHPTARVP